MRHGSESFFIEGEGLVDASLDGRSGATADRVDDPAATGPSLAAGVAPPFRFSRAGPRSAHHLSEQNRRKIAEAMILEGKVSTGVPAGFTYLGQFVDHDLTAD